jgi:predicted transcriptional regulator of viral defense system
MSAMTDRIMKRVRSRGRGWVFTPKDFIDFGTRGSVDMALSRLAKGGGIRRIGRGLYHYPVRHDKLGDLTPDPARIAEALSKQSGDQLAASGAAAVNRLGLSNQVPARMSFATTGRSRIREAAGRSFTFKHSRAPVLANAPDAVNAVVQALAHLGRHNVDGETIQRFASRLGDHDLRLLDRARPDMPGWMSDVVLKIGRARNG